MTTLKGQFTTVTIDEIVFTAVYANEQYFITASEINEKVDFASSKNTMSRDLKRILGKGFSIIQIKLPNSPKAQSCIEVESLAHVLLKLALVGHPKAAELSEALIGLSLTQLCADAFGHKFEAAERAQWLEERLSHCKQYLPLFCRWVRADGLDAKHGRFAFTGRISQLKKTSGLPGNLKVDEMTSDELRTINQAEAMYNKLRLKGFSHNEAIDLIK